MVRVSVKSSKAAKASSGEREMTGARVMTAKNSDKFLHVVNNSCSESRRDRAAE